MKQRIFAVITGIVMTSIMILCLLTTTIYYSFYKSQSESDIKSIANLFIDSDENLELINKNIIKNFPYDIRMTQVDANGTVMFDTVSGTYDNHLNRPEIKEALKNGIGYDTRKSETLGKNAYYYAAKCENGTILRFSRQIDSISSIFISIIPFIILSAFVVVLIATIFASKLSNNIIKPISNLVNSINIINNKKNVNEIDVNYEELQPIAISVKALTKEMNTYIERLKEEKATINLITDNMVEGMILLDSNLNILSVNKSATNILNKDFVLEKTKNVLQLTRNSLLISAVNRVNSSGKSRNIIIENDDYFYNVFINKVETSNISHGIIVLLVDSTENIKAELIRREFAANVSHELKTPLTTIKGFSEMLSAGIVDNKEDIKKYSTRIYCESERLLLLINDIIHLSEVEEIGDTFEETQIDLKESAAQVYAMLNSSAESKKITLTFEGVSVTIDGNKSYINQLIYNLTDNSIKYTNSGGFVKIIIEDNDDFAIIKVVDNGIGIPMSSQDRIFERFYRVDKSRSKQTGGTGLGLSIVKHIVYSHGGKINLISELNKGTEITVSLPKT